nr:ribonuclease H-like domain-containing protein [Tanacetum cinerariifolium]
MVAVIVCKLDQWKMNVPTSLEVHDARSEHVFKGLNCTLALTISLWMVAIRLVDEYSFVIRPSLVRLTSRSCEDRPVISTTMIMRRTLMVTLVFTLCEEQVIWNSDLMRLMDDLLALDSIVHFGFSDQRLERTAPFQYQLTQRDDENATNPPSIPPTQQAPHTLSTVKLPILKKVPPKNAEEILARERERKARTTLLMAIPKDHLAKFHKITDAKEMWEAIKSRFGRNDESKKKQKYILKQQFKSFFVSNSKGLHKGYDRFQSLLSQLEIYGAGVSTEDAKQKFLRVFKSDVKGSTASSSSTQNVAFISSNSTSNTNEVGTAYGVSTSSGHNSQREGSSSYTDELMFSFFANQSIGLQLDHDDLVWLDEFNLEEMDFKWHVAMISMRLKKFYKKTLSKLHFDAKEPVGFNKTKVKCFNFHNTGHFVRECRSKGNQESKRRNTRNTRHKARDNERRPAKQDEPKTMVTIDGVVLIGLVMLKMTHRTML